jgi:hypothetical protein
MEKVLSKKTFPQWVKKLESYTIYAPMKDGDFWNFEVIKNSEIIDLNYLTTVLSPKKIIFPQREVLLEFSTSDENRLEVKEVLPAMPRRLLLRTRFLAVTLKTFIIGKEETQQHLSDLLVTHLLLRIASVSRLTAPLILKKAWTS